VVNPFTLAMEKVAYEVKPQQERVLKKLDANGGVVVMHGMGSGKTLTSLIAAEREQKRDPNAQVLAVVPAPLVSNMYDQAKEHKVDLDYKRFNVVSYDKAVNMVRTLKASKPRLLVLDEGQRIRNVDTSRSKAIRDLAKTSDKVMVLSGTPDYNGPHDMSVLVNTVAKQPVLPEDKKEFEARYIDNVEVKPGFFAQHFLGVKPGTVQRYKNKAELRKVLSKYVDTYDAREATPEHFPTAKERVIKVDMDAKQEQMYKFVEGRVPFYIRWKISRGLPLSKSESKDLNAFATGVRQVSNTLAAYDKTANPASPKIKTMADHIEYMKVRTPNFRSIAYSNYLESGLKPLSDELNRRGIKHALYDGSLSQKEKDSIVHDYNTGKLDTVLVSSSGQEGLNLKGTKLVQIMEPHFNRSKIDQVIARGIRFNSHAHLPENERHVEVVHYQSTLPKHLLQGPHTSIDEYLYDSSERKKHLQNELRGMMKQAMDKRAEGIGTLIASGLGLHLAQNAYMGSQLALRSGAASRMVSKLRSVHVPYTGALGDLSRSPVLRKTESFVADKEKKIYGQMAAGGTESWGGHFYKGLHDKYPSWGSQIKDRVLSPRALIPEEAIGEQKMRALGQTARQNLLAKGLRPENFSDRQGEMFAHMMGGNLSKAQEHYATLSRIDPHKARNIADAAEATLKTKGIHIDVHKAMMDKEYAAHLEEALGKDLVGGSLRRDISVWRPAHVLPDAPQGAPQSIRNWVSRMESSRVGNLPGVRNLRDYAKRHLDAKEFPQNSALSFATSATLGVVDPALGGLNALKHTMEAPELHHRRYTQALRNAIFLNPLRRAVAAGRQGNLISPTRSVLESTFGSPVLGSARRTANQTAYLTEQHGLFTDTPSTAAPVHEPVAAPAVAPVHEPVAAPVHRESPSQQQPLPVTRGFSVGRHVLTPAAYGMAAGVGVGGAAAAAHRYLQQRNSR